MWVFRGGWLKNRFLVHPKFFSPKKGYKTIPEEASPTLRPPVPPPPPEAPPVPPTPPSDLPALPEIPPLTPEASAPGGKGGGGFRFSSRPYEGKPPFSRSFTPYYISSPLFFFQNHPCKWYPYISLYIPEFLRLKRSLFRLTSWIFKNRGLVSWVRLVF